MSDIREPAEEDLVSMLDYLDGSLSPEQMGAFEARLADDPALEAAFETLRQLDGFERASRVRFTPRAAEVPAQTAPTKDQARAL